MMPSLCGSHKHGGDCGLLSRCGDWDDDTSSTECPFPFVTLFVWCEDVCDEIPERDSVLAESSIAAAPGVADMYDSDCVNQWKSSISKLRPTEGKMFSISVGAECSRICLRPSS